MRCIAAMLLILFGICVTLARPVTGWQKPLPPGYLPSGAVLYQQACASCHGADARGHGPAAAALKIPPPDLTTLARRHAGRFPYDYVTSVLLVGAPLPSHGSPDMPVWGPIFKFIDKDNKQAVLKRVKSLSDYLESLQVR